MHTNTGVCMPNLTDYHFFATVLHFSFFPSEMFLQRLAFVWKNVEKAEGAGMAADLEILLLDPCF